MSIRLSTGLRQALLGNVPVRKASVVINAQTTIAAVDGGTSPDSFTDSGSGFVTAGFSVGDSFMVYGFTGGMAAIYGPFTALTVADGAITVATGSLANDEAGEAVTMVLLKGGSWRDIFKDGVLDIYSGTIPATADAAETGTKLASITISSGAFVAGAPANGLEFGAPASGVISKDAATWSGVGLATGEAGYYVFYDNAKVTGLSTTSVRFMGTCGESGTDMVMSDATVTAAATKTIDTFSITLPAN